MKTKIPLKEQSIFNLAMTYWLNQPCVVHFIASAFVSKIEWLVATNWLSLQILNDSFKNQRSSPVGDGNKYKYSKYLFSITHV